MAPKKKAKTVQKDIGPRPRTRAFAIEEGSHHVGESPRLPGAFDDRHRTPKKPSKHTLRDFYLTPLPLGYKSASKSHLAPEVADVRGKNVLHAQRTLMAICQLATPAVGYHQPRPHKLSQDPQTHVKQRQRGNWVARRERRGDGGRPVEIPARIAGRHGYLAVDGMQ